MQKIAYIVIFHLFVIFLNTQCLLETIKEGETAHVSYYVRPILGILGRLYTSASRLAGYS